MSVELVVFKRSGPLGVRLGQSEISGEIYIKQIRTRSESYFHGVRQHDVILSINGRRPTNTDEALHVLGTAKRLELELLRPPDTALMYGCGSLTDSFSKTSSVPLTTLSSPVRPVPRPRKRTKRTARNATPVGAASEERAHESENVAKGGGHFDSNVDSEKIILDFTGNRWTNDPARVEVVQEKTRYSERYSPKPSIDSRLADTDTVHEQTSNDLWNAWHMEDGGIYSNNQYAPTTVTVQNDQLDARGRNLSEPQLEQLQDFRTHDDIRPLAESHEECAIQNVVNEPLGDVTNRSLQPKVENFHPLANFPANVVKSTTLSFPGTTECTTSVLNPELDAAAVPTKFPKTEFVDDTGGIYSDLRLSPDPVGLYDRDNNKSIEHLPVLSECRPLRKRFDSPASLGFQSDSNVTSLPRNFNTVRFSNEVRRSYSPVAFSHEPNNSQFPVTQSVSFSNVDRVCAQALYPSGRLSPLLKCRSGSDISSPYFRSNHNRVFTHLNEDSDFETTAKCEDFPSYTGSVKREAETKRSEFPQVPPPETVIPMPIGLTSGPIVSTVPPPVAPKPTILPKLLTSHDVIDNHQVSQRSPRSHWETKRRLVDTHEDFIQRASATQVTNFRTPWVERTENDCMGQDQQINTQVVHAVPSGPVSYDQPMILEKEPGLQKPDVGTSFPVAPPMSPNQVNQPERIPDQETASGFARIILGQNQEMPKRRNPQPEPCSLRSQFPLPRDFYTNFEERDHVSPYFLPRSSGLSAKELLQTKTDRPSEPLPQNDRVEVPQSVKRLNQQDFAPQLKCDESISFSQPIAANIDQKNLEPQPLVADPQPLVTEITTRETPIQQQFRIDETDPIQQWFYNDQPGNASTEITTIHEIGASTSDTPLEQMDEVLRYPESETEVIETDCGPNSNISRPPPKLPLNIELPEREKESTNNPPIIPDILITPDSRPASPILYLTGSFPDSPQNPQTPEPTDTVFESAPEGPKKDTADPNSHEVLEDFPTLQIHYSRTLESPEHDPESQGSAKVADGKKDLEKPGAAGPATTGTPNEPPDALTQSLVRKEGPPAVAIASVCKRFIKSQQSLARAQLANALPYRVVRTFYVPSTITHSASLRAPSHATVQTTLPHIKRPFTAVFYATHVNCEFTREPKQGAVWNMQNSANASLSLKPFILGGDPGLEDETMKKRAAAAKLADELKQAGKFQQQQKHVEEVLEKRKKYFDEANSQPSTAPKDSSAVLFQKDMKTVSRCIVQELIASQQSKGSKMFKMKRQASAESEGETPPIADPFPPERIRLPEPFVPPKVELQNKEHVYSKSYKHSHHYEEPVAKPWNLHDLVARDDDPYNPIALPPSTSLRPRGLTDDTKPPMSWSQFREKQQEDSPHQEPPLYSYRSSFHL